VHALVATFPADTDVPPSEGAVRALTLVDRADAGIVSIALFESEEQARQAAAAAEAGTVETYDVATEQLRPGRPARYARVATHHGFPMRDVSPAPIAGLEGLAGWLMLIDRRSGKGLGILLFESEEALERGDAFVSEASPGTAGPASDVAFYDVGLARS